MKAISKIGAPAADGGDRDASLPLSKKAYHLIKDKIVTLQYRPLAVIDEQVLIEELGMGRTPIREALHRLSAEGLVIIAPRRGMFVADISITDLQKIFEVRMLLEGFCARLAAQRATAEQIAAMEAALAELEALPPDDSRAIMAVDERLHELLYEAADNPFLTYSLERLHALSLRLWYLALDQLQDFKLAVQEHGPVVAAIQARDEALAEQLIREHIAGFQREVRTVL